jgi:hypothetical protein
LSDQYWCRPNLPNNNYEQVTEIVESPLGMGPLLRMRRCPAMRRKISQLETIFEVTPLAYLKTSLKFERSRGIAWESRRNYRVSNIRVTDH